MTPAGAKLRYLGELGPVNGLRMSWTIPGGCDQLSATLNVSPMLRTEALDPGRIVQVLYGASVTWEGTLDEPHQAADGWSVTAHGSGTWGSDYAANYSGTWSAAKLDTCVDNAIGRGLGWVRVTDISAVSGVWAGQPPDPGSVMIDEMLNQACGLGGLTWYVRRSVEGNRLYVIALPTAPNRLLVCTQPAPRTLGGDTNAILIRYKASPDMPGVPATYAAAWATDDKSIARHGRKETFLDISSAGVLTGTDATNVGNYVLRRYQRASYAGPFTARRGQLLSSGGSPQDLAIFWESQSSHGPMVCRLLLADQAWGGEVVPGPVTFLVGGYEYDDDLDQAVITPFNSLRSDVATFLSNYGQTVHGRRVIVNPHGRRHVHYTGRKGHRRRHVTWTPTWRFK